MAAALLFGAVGVAVVPHLGLGELVGRGPIELPAFQPLSQPTHVYDPTATHRGVPAPEQPADRAGARSPSRRPSSVPGRRGPRVLPAQRRQRPGPVPGDAVERRLRRGAAGRLDDHDAGGQERVPRRARPRLPLQGAPDPLRDDARERVHQGRDPRALPQHRVLRQQRLRRRRRPPRPTSARPSTQLNEIQAAFLAGLVRSPSGYDPIDNPERSRARFHQVLDGSSTRHDHRGRGARPCRPRSRSRPGCRRSPSRGTTARTYFTEALHRLPPQPLRHARAATYQERYSELYYRGGLRIHTTSNPIPAEGRGGPQRAAGHAAGLRRGHRVARHQTGAIVAMVGGRGFARQTRSTWRSSPPDRLQHQVLHPRCGTAGRRAARRRHRRAAPVRAAQPRRSERAVRDHRRGRAASPTRCGDDVGVDQLRVRAAGPDRRAQPSRRHDVPDGRSRLPVSRAGPRTDRDAIQPYRQR